MKTSTQPVIAVNFQPRARLKALGGGLYVMPGTEGFFARPVCAGRQREKKLRSLTERAARAELGKLLHEIARFEAGLGPDPWHVSHERSMSDLAKFYIERGCPGRRNGAARSAQCLENEIRQAERIAAWPGSRLPASQVTLDVCQRYHDWRVRKIARGKGGDRQVDKELATLSNIFRCAARAANVTGVTSNPMAHDRPTFRLPAEVRHCRDTMPRSGDDLHAIARAFFDGGRTREALGWLVLIASITGQRMHEVLAMRMTARNKQEPGFMAGRRLYLFRSVTSKGTFGHVDLNESEMECVMAHHAWHARSWAQSEHWFPMPSDATRTFRSDYLSGVLHVLGLPAYTVTAHGLRAFRVNVLRARGLPDAEIALRIGQKTGGRLIVQVYGEGLDVPLQWLPSSGPPAWSVFTHQPSQLELGL